MAFSPRLLEFARSAVSHEDVGVRIGWSDCMIADLISFGDCSPLSPVPAVVYFYIDYLVGVANYFSGVPARAAPVFDFLSRVELPAHLWSRCKRMSKAIARDLSCTRMVHEVVSTLYGESQGARL